MNALRSAVKVRGLAAIDNRTRAARDLIQWRSELIRDLGGEESLSAQKMALVEAVTRTRLFVDHLDAFLLSQQSLVNKKKKSVLPAVRERQTLVDLMARLLGQLGLDRIAKDAGQIPASWIEKVKPHEIEPEVQQTELAAKIEESTR